MKAEQALIVSQQLMDMHSKSELHRSRSFDKKYLTQLSHPSRPAMLQQIHESLSQARILLTRQYLGRSKTPLPTMGRPRRSQHQRNAKSSQSPRKAASPLGVAIQ
jgi:hypothetical protein